MDKNDSIKQNIAKCKLLIEQKLNWAPNTILTKREFELLIEKIFDSTGVLLSLSTIRRIWNDDFKNIPHKSTLDALAKYAGYNNWQGLIESDQQLDVIPKISKTNNRTVFVIVIVI
ncbi:MAG: hypothetical protein QM503_11765, partial [Bacteroidota bacterium]